MNNRAVIAIVHSRIQAESIVSALRDSEFHMDNISVLFPDRHGTANFAYENNTKAPEASVAGGAGGGVIGGTLGLLAGIGALAIPGLGPFIAAGPLMAALSGAAAGAAVGAVAGALVGLGIPEIEAKKYEGKLLEGNILIAVHVENGEEEDRAKAVFKQWAASDVSVLGESAVPKRSAATSHR